MPFGVQRRSAVRAAIIVTMVGALPASARPASPADYRAYLSDCHSRHVCNGTYIVAQKGRPVFAGAFGDTGDERRTPLTIDSSFDIGSISKQFTAMAVLRLIHEGKIKLDARVAGYLPNFPYTDITVRQLLSHTSGIADAMPYYTNLIRSGAPEKPVTGADVVTVLASQHMQRLAPEGARYAYSNTGYMVLAALVERQTGRPFGAYLQQAFFGPLGLHDTRLRTPASEAAIRNRAFGFADAPVGKRRLSDQFPGLYMQGAGGIYSTAPDLLKWENALNAGRVVPKKLLAMATTPARLIDGTSVPYGFGLSLKPDVGGNYRVSHGGHWRAFKSDLSYYPAINVTVIQLTNNNQDDSVDTNASALATMATGGTPPALRGPIGWALAERAGRDDARQWFIAQLARQPREYDIEETDLNGLGYAYLKEKDTTQAIRVFELETLAFPKSPNAFDSLADAQEATGDLSGAKASVTTALNLNPQAQAYKKRLADLNTRAQ